MNRSDATEYVSFVVDDSLNGRELNADIHAIVREAGETVLGPEDQELPAYKYNSVLVGWQCGFEPLFVAVHSYLDVELDDEEAEELATDYLVERNWFGDNFRSPDYIIR